MAFTLAVTLQVSRILSRSYIAYVSDVIEDLISR